MNTKLDDAKGTFETLRTSFSELSRQQADVSGGLCGRTAASIRDSFAEMSAPLTELRRSLDATTTIRPGEPIRVVEFTALQQLISDNQTYFSSLGRCETREGNVIDISIGLQQGLVPQFEQLQFFSSLEQFRMGTSSTHVRSGIDHRPLGNLLTLESLSLHNTGLDNLEWITPLKKLYSLTLVRAKIDSLTPLESLPNLEKLDLNDVAVRDLDSFRCLPPSLRSLELLHYPYNSLAQVAKAGCLEELVLMNTAVSDITPLASLTTLKSLKILDNSLDERSVAFLSDLRSAGIEVTYVE